MKKVRLASVLKGCVACGNCMNHCPRNAIVIHRGICAVVDEKICVGCGKCEKACPAGVMEIIMKEAEDAK